MNPIEKIKMWTKVRANLKKADELSKSNKKIDRLAGMLLMGVAVTGRTMIEEFNIYSYRDAIYDLGKKGYSIERKVVRSANGVEHKVWWLSDYSEDFIRERSPRAFK